MPRVRLIHWKAEEVEERAARLRAAGYDVDGGGVGPEELKLLRTNPPAAFVIDLSRLPSHGREAALALCETKATRNVPIVFVEGEADKTAKIKALFPDATFTTWKGIRDAVRKAIARPPVEPIAPRSRMDGYSGTPLPKKLGVKADSAVLLVGAPKGFERSVNDLPEGVKFLRAALGASRRRATGTKVDLILWFVTSQEELARGAQTMASARPSGGLWIIWPKKTSGVQSDLSESLVRKAGLAVGLVDSKVCAVDAVWSGLRFTRRT